MVDGKSPRLCRKFSSPPPLAVSRTSSPVRARKLSLTSSLNARIGALDLTTSSSSSSPTTHSPTSSPPPHAGKVPLHPSKVPSAPEQSAGALGENADGPMGICAAGCTSSVFSHMITFHSCHCLISTILSGMLISLCLFGFWQFPQFCIESTMDKMPVDPRASLQILALEW